MTYATSDFSSELSSLPRLPGWSTVRSAQTAEQIAFLSGAGLCVLDALVRHDSGRVPTRLLANRLALRCAAATSKLEGRFARESDIRDAFRFASSDAERGPDGDVLAFWRRVARLRPTFSADIDKCVGDPFADTVGTWLSEAAQRTQSHGPASACLDIMAKVLQADDRAERFACLLSDIVLARAMGWDQPLPLTALHLTKTDLRDLNAGSERGVGQGIIRAIQTAVHLCHQLMRHAAALRALAPKLRARGAKDAVGLFLSEDAVAPSTMLSPCIQGTNVAMTDRAARRLCDRLVDLGVARELTGRATFRLYGLLE
ncbi:MAG: DUF1403 family protein [Pseudomonadota bacterium]